MKKQKIKNIIFDLGGVLIDWNPRYLYNRLLKNDQQKIDYFLTSICSQTWNEEQDKGRSFDEGVAILSEQYPDFTELIQAYHIHWGDMLGAVISETLEILKQLRKSSYQLYALTNWSKEKFPFALEKFDFLQWFKEIMVSGEVHLKKPDPKIYALLFEKCDIVPEESLFIDDSFKNIEISRTLGMPGIVFENGLQLKKALLNFGIDL